MILDFSTDYQSQLCFITFCALKMNLFTLHWLYNLNKYLYQKHVVLLKGLLSTTWIWCLFFTIPLSISYPSALSIDLSLCLIFSFTLSSFFGYIFNYCFLDKSTLIFSCFFSSESLYSLLWSYFFFSGVMLETSRVVKGYCSWNNFFLCSYLHSLNLKPFL